MKRLLWAIVISLPALAALAQTEHMHPPGASDDCSTLPAPLQVIVATMEAPGVTVQVAAGGKVLQADVRAMLDRLPGLEVFGLPIRALEQPEVVAVRAFETGHLLLPRRAGVAVINRVRV